eukprot:CAMPEP_0206538794 /NCGR_PEP_ID=MMETSP0325_2-20121206/8079_1 /ASSEMBLY_ACC=CAM_ASM_000347 /TAXON_ID=2866 /ORGANISM="Crypthecodinium cohnii, Strain Seligo" /LENGTH=241 /DNA_ID=CAMNT_0054036309 /DNA_START=282 /DNA_END=1004 /DNA_ORIENTATION=-
MSGKVRTWGRFSKGAIPSPTDGLGCLGRRSGRCGGLDSALFGPPNNTWGAAFLWLIGQLMLPPPLLLACMLVEESSQDDSTPNLLSKEGASSFVALCFGSAHSISGTGTCLATSATFRKITPLGLDWAAEGSSVLCWAGSSTKKTTFGWGCSSISTQSWSVSTTIPPSFASRQSTFPRLRMDSQSASNSSKIFILAGQIQKYLSIRFTKDQSCYTPPTARFAGKRGLCKSQAAVAVVAVAV